MQKDLEVMDYRRVQDAVHGGADLALKCCRGPGAPEAVLADTHPPLGCSRCQRANDAVHNQVLPHSLQRARAVVANG